MTKQEFLSELRRGISGLPQNDIEERVNFYSEMIDDRMEEGLSEEEAVEGIGSVDSVVSQILSDIPLSKLVKEKIKPKKQLEAWMIALIILGTPLWFAIGITVVSALFACFVTVLSLVVSFWAVFASIVIVAPGSIITGIAAIVAGNTLTGIVMIGIGLICAGISIFAFFICKAITKGIIFLAKKLIVLIKKCFMNNNNNKERA